MATTTKPHRPRPEECRLFFEEARLEMQAAQKELADVQDRLQRAQQKMAAWAVLGQELGEQLMPGYPPGYLLPTPPGPPVSLSTRLPPPPPPGSLFDPNTATIADLMTSYMQRHIDEGPFMPRTVHLGIVTEFGRRLSPAAITNTRDRHPELFVKVRGRRGAFTLTARTATSPSGEPGRSSKKAT